MLSQEDASLVSHIQSALRTIPGLDPSSIGVSAHNGAITLTGTVSGQGMAARVMKAVRAVHSTGRIADKLVLREKDGAALAPPESGHERLEHRAARKRHIAAAGSGAGKIIIRRSAGQAHQELR